MQETGCSISAAHLCTWSDRAPNNYKERNDPCVGLSLAAAMSEAGLLPVNIMFIICIMRIIAILELIHIRSIICLDQGGAERKELEGRERKQVL